MRILASILGALAVAYATVRAAETKFYRDQARRDATRNG